MLYYDRIDSARSNTSKECIFLYLINVFDLMMCHNISNTYLINVFNLTMCLNTSHIASITVEGIDYRFIIHDISKSEALHLLKNSVLDDSGYK